VCFRNTKLKDPYFEINKEIYKKRVTNKCKTRFKKQKLNQKSKKFKMKNNQDIEFEWLWNWLIEEFQRVFGIIHLNERNYTFNDSIIQDLYEFCWLDRE